MNSAGFFCRMVRPFGLALTIALLTAVPAVALERLLREAPHAYQAVFAAQWLKERK